MFTVYVYWDGRSLTIHCTAGAEVCIAVIDINWQDKMARMSYDTHDHSAALYCSIQLQAVVYAVL